MRTLPAFLSLSLGLLVSIPSWSADGDWHQWRGPNRTGHAAPQALLQTWPADGPSVIWSFANAGTGYSSMSIDNGQLFTMGTIDDECVVLCLDANNGELKWKQAISRAAKEDEYLQKWGGGPRSTPTVDGASIYAISDIGTLAKLDRKTGKVQWSVDFLSLPEAQIPKWGYAESALIDGDRVVVTPGGENFMVAFDKETGKQVWTSKGVNETAAYASIIKHTFDDVTFYTTAGPGGLYGFDTTTGEQLFHSSVTGNPTAVIPTPIADGPHVYHTSAYGAGNALLELKSDANGKLTATQQYHIDEKSMQNHHGGVVLVDGVIYGFSKSDGGQWMAQDLQSGETLWQERLRGNRSGSIAYADGRLYCYNDGDGTVYLIAPNRDGWKATGELTIPEETELPRGSGAIWTHPVIAGQKLYIRDQDRIFAFDIAR